MARRLMPLAVVLAVFLASCAGNTPERWIWAAFTERGLSGPMKLGPMKSGTNVRIFNDVNVDAQDDIKYDNTTG